MTHREHRLRRTLLFVLAVIFIFEAWLFDVTGRAISQIIAHVPIERARQYVAKRIAGYSPWLTLTVFVIPVLVLLPLKFTVVWMLAQGYVFSALLMAVLAKLLGIGVFSFLFAVCKPKLMQLAWVRWIYDTILHWLDKAHRFADPYMVKVRAKMAELRALLPHSKLREKIRAARVKRKSA